MLLALIAARAMAQSENCHPLDTVRPPGDLWATIPNILKPGDYCLLKDVKAPRVYVISEGGEKAFLDGAMLLISVPNLSIDLRGFTLDADPSGMGAIFTRRNQGVPYLGHIIIRNGTIVSRTDNGINLGSKRGSLLSDYQEMYRNSKYAQEEFEKLLKSLPANAAAYPKTEHKLENLRIFASNNIRKKEWSRSGVGLYGADNVIRNSTIEVGGSMAAIYSFGPNGVIENNIIIFKGEAGTQSAAPIKLHHGDGTIIRNNDIIVESSGDYPPKAAISLIDSKDVIVENNRIYGIDKLVQAWDDKSNLIDKGNEFRSLLRRPWTVFGAPGVH